MPDFHASASVSCASFSGTGRKRLPSGAMPKPISVSLIDAPEGALKVRERMESLHPVGFEFLPIGEEVGLPPGEGHELRHHRIEMLRHGKSGARAVALCQPGNDLLMLGNGLGIAHR